MSLRCGKVGLVMFGCLVLVSVVPAQQAKDDDPAAAEKEVLSTKGTQTPHASSVNFRKDLKLPFDSLSTLGSRIDTARRKPDPVALAHAANELAVAEKVSGKKASITSKQVLQESVELAKARKQESELTAVLHVSEQMAVEADNRALLQKEIALAKAQTKEDQDALNRQLEPTNAPRKVVENNYTTQYLDIYVNGNYKVQILPGSTQVITIEHRWNPTVLKAFGNEDAMTWGPQYIWGRFTKYTWNIN